MKLIATVLSVLLSVQAYAQDTLKLSLADAIKYGVDNNKSLQAERLDEQLESLKLQELNSDLYPNVYAAAGVSRYVNIPKQYVAADLFTPNAPSNQYTGLQLLLPNSFNLGLSANWTIYNRGIYSARNILKVQNEIRGIKFERNKSELAVSISQLYYGIVFFNKQHESLSRILINVDRLMRILQLNFYNGLIKKSDLDKVKVTKVNLESQLEGLKTAIDTQTKLLKLLIGVSTEKQIKLMDTEYKVSITPIDLPNSDLEKTFDLQMIQAQMKLSALERKSILSSYFPTLGLSYNLSYNTVNPRFSDVFSASYSYRVQMIGIYLSVPVFDGNRNIYKLKQNDVALSQLGLQSQFLAEKVRVEIENSYLQYKSSLIAVASSKSNTVLAERLYDQSILEYEQGIISLNDVLITENALRETQTVYFNSISAALIALLEYKRATNTIFQ